MADLREELQAASIRVSEAKIALDRAVEEYGHARSELTLLQRKWGRVE